jgi:hypothetical protein
LASLQNTLYLTGVQLEKGSLATPFEQRPLQTELAMCQRYYQKFGNTHLGNAYNGTYLNSGTIPFKTTMRAIPSIDAGASFSVTSGSVGTVGVNNLPAGTNVSTDTVSVYNSAGNWTTNAQVSASLSMNAEL